MTHKRPPVQSGGYGTAGVVQIHIDRLVLDDFPDIDAQQFRQSLQRELNRILTENAEQFQWGRVYSTTRIDAGELAISADSTPQEAGRQVAGQISKGLFGRRE